MTPLTFLYSLSAARRIHFRSSAARPGEKTMTRIRCLAVVLAVVCCCAAPGCRPSDSVVVPPPVVEETADFVVASLTENSSIQVTKDDVSVEVQGVRKTDSGGHLASIKLTVRYKGKSFTRTAKDVPVNADGTMTGESKASLRTVIDDMKKEMIKAG
jgi:hypothetical protein